MTLCAQYGSFLLFKCVALKGLMEVQTNWHGTKFWHFQRISSVERGKLKEVNKTQEDMLWKREKPKFKRLRQCWEQKIQKGKLCGKLPFMGS